MRQSHPDESLKRLCALFGVSRQAYYDAQLHDNRTSIANMIVLTLVKDLRDEIPILGTRKLIFMLQEEFPKHGIKMGRDKLFDLLRFHGLLIRRRKRIAKTTESHHWMKKYPNLIKELIITCAEQLWVSDITYVRTLQGFSYLSLITDAYSRKIVGYALNQTLSAAGPLKALKMALSERRRNVPFILIHHSDRGIQYCSAEYVQILIGEKIAISMTQTGSPYDNALAERVNGTIKNDFFPKRIYKNYEEAEKAICGAIKIYNKFRPHDSLDYLTPELAHERSEPITKKWKTYKKQKEVTMTETR
jgi:transposase InsO family protein